MKEHISTVMPCNFDGVCNHINFESLIWLTTREAAIYIRRIDENGNPSLKSIYQAIYKRKIKAKKFLGKWMIKKTDLDRSIETSRR